MTRAFKNNKRGCALTFSPYLTLMCLSSFCLTTSFSSLLSTGPVTVETCSYRKQLGKQLQRTIAWCARLMNGGFAVKIESAYEMQCTINTGCAAEGASREHIHSHFRLQSNFTYILQLCDQPVYIWLVDNKHYSTCITK